MYFYRMNPKLEELLSGPIMTVVLNLNDSNPNTWATYKDDAVGMTAGSNDWDEFFGHYPCILENGVELGKLKRNNFGQYENGNAAPITTLGKDVMICFPKRGIKIEYLDANTLSVSMTSAKHKKGYSYMAHSYKGNAISNFYLGAYAGYQSGSNLYSTSGKSPSVNANIGNFRTYAQARGTGYEQSGFFQLTYRQVMYLLKYKGQNAQIAVGRGYVDGNGAAHATGGLNTNGMDWGETAGKTQMKLFGIEDFYGNTWEFIDGVWSNSNRQIYVADGNFNNSGTGYTDAGTQSISSNLQGYLRYPNGSNLAGFINKSSTYGTNSTYFCDNTNLNSSCIACFGGVWNNGSESGVFRLNMSRGGSYSASSYGARLMYLGG